MIIALLLALAAPRAAPALQRAAVVSAVRVQGNVITPDDDVIRLGGVEPGAPFDSGTVARVKAALEASHRFEHVEVLQRFDSLSDPSRILLVIIVDEGPLKVTGRGDNATIARSGGLHLLFTPLLKREEGYGWSYGARVAKTDVMGARSRLSFPLTWGADKRAGAEVDKSFDRGPLTRAQATVSISRRTNPFYGADDDRVRAAVRGERHVVSHVTAGATVAAEHVSFLGADERLMEAGVDATLDTRLDPMLSRNAVYARAAWEHLSIADGTPVARTSLEGHVYAGLPARSILVVRALREGADGALPPYLKPLLGGIDTLRGFAVGYRAGDTLVSGSAEVRRPLTSPLGIAKLGVRAFIDAGTVYDHGERLRDQSIDRGLGGGVWVTAAVVRLSLDVAHGVGASTRVHFGTSVNF